MNFTVIVNPDDGPGSNDLPDANYVTAIKTLNASPNVQVIGYVHTSYATRAAEQVIADVVRYASWPLNSPGLHVDGIFFDEAPHAYSNDTAAYLSRIDNAVKTADGIQGTKTVRASPRLLILLLTVC